jgi:starch phosphorylase
MVDSWRARDVLLTHGEYSLHLADVSNSRQTQEQVGMLYTQPDMWARKAILNVAHAGKFSSDRTIVEYAADIWQAKPCPVELAAAILGQCRKLREGTR